MRKKIGNKIYDTARAQEVGRQTVSFFGDPYGFEEIMFQKDEKEYFLLAKGGELSQYVEEQIIPLQLADAREWLMRITGEEHANYLIPETGMQEEEKAPKKRAPRTAKPTQTKAKASKAAPAKRATAAKKAPVAKKESAKVKAEPAKAPAKRGRKPKAK